MKSKNKSSQTELDHEGNKARVWNGAQRGRDEHVVLGPGLAQM